MKKELTLLILAFSLFACESENILESNTIDSNIQITPVEFFDQNSLLLGLSCETEEIYPCANYSILTEVNFSDNIISIDFKEVPEIDICLTGFGPASTTINLSEFSHGDYKLELKNGSLKNEGKLKITNSEISLGFNSQKGIQILRKSTKRIPNNTYWGTVGYHNETTIKKVNEFLDMLKAKDEVINFNKQDSGIYTFFEINEDGEIIPRENSGYHFTKYFIFQYNGEDKERFKTNIDLLSTSYFDEMIVNFQNAEGDRIYNWD